jgi:hypothetical protein
MSGLHLRSASINVPCPVCGSTIYTTYGHVIDDATVLCPRGHSVQFVDSGDSVRRLDRSLSDLSRQVRRLGRRR